MIQSMIKQVEDISTKESHNKYIIFTDRNRSTLELYNNDVNTHDVTAGVDNNHNKYNINNIYDEDGANDK